MLQYDEEVDQLASLSVTLEKSLSEAYALSHERPSHVLTAAAFSALCMLRDGTTSSLSRILKRVVEFAMQAIYVGEDCFESPPLDAMHDYVSKRT